MSPAPDLAEISDSISEIISDSISEYDLAMADELTGAGAELLVRTNRAGYDESVMSEDS